LLHNAYSAHRSRLTGQACIESHVIHASSVAVTREHRRAKTDRLDTELLKRGFLGWLRGERGHCKMVAVPTLAEEDAKRRSRERETLVGEASRIITRIKAAFVPSPITHKEPGAPGQIALGTMFLSGGVVSRRVRGHRVRGAATGLSDRLPR
jgi:hypothetical protein